MIEAAYVYNASLHRVIDGDTYELAIDVGFKLTATLAVRLLHIDVYEHNTPLGKQAIEFVTGVCRGKTLLVRTKKDEQTFARYLADIWVNGELLSDLLKAAGFANPDSPWNT